MSNNFEEKMKNKQKERAVSKLFDGAKPEATQEATSPNEKGSEEMTTQTNDNNTTSSQTISGLSDELKGIYKERAKKKKLDESHTRATFLVENELLDKLNAICQNQRGYKTILINKALATLLNEFDLNDFVEEEEE